MNEKYKGDALLQKSYTVDFLTKKQKVNHGEVQQYYVENNHPAIIKPEVFDLVQQELVSRLSGQGRYSGVDRFSAKIKCGQCGGWYGPKVWHSNSKYRRVVYQCNGKYKNGCSTPHLDEKQIENIFIASVNRLLTMKDELIANLTDAQSLLCDTAELAEEEQSLREEMETLVRMIENGIAENASRPLDQDDYQRQYDRLVAQYEDAKRQLATVTQSITERKAKCDNIRNFIQALQEQEGLILEFDENLWGSLVQYITVCGEGDFRVAFKDGTEI